MKERQPVTRADRLDPRTGERCIIGWASTELGAKRVIAKSGRIVPSMELREYQGREVWEPVGLCSG